MSDEIKESGESVTLGCLLMLLSIPAGAALRGLALKMLWAWYVVPLGAPSIGAVHALGLAALLILANSQRASVANAAGRTTLEQAGESLGWSLLPPACSLLFGWLLSFWM